MFCYTEIFTVTRGLPEANFPFSKPVVKCRVKRGARWNVNMRTILTLFFFLSFFTFFFVKSTGTWARQGEPLSCISLWWIPERRYCKEVTSINPLLFSIWVNGITWVPNWESSIISAISLGPVPSITSHPDAQRSLSYPCVLPLSPPNIQSVSTSSFFS